MFMVNIVMASVCYSQILCCVVDFEKEMGREIESKRERGELASDAHTTLTNEILLTFVYHSWWFLFLLLCVQLLLTESQQNAHFGCSSYGRRIMGEAQRNLQSNLPSSTVRDMRISICELISFVFSRSF